MIFRTYYTYILYIYIYKNLYITTFSDVLLKMLMQMNAIAENQTEILKIVRSLSYKAGAHGDDFEDLLPTKLETPNALEVFCQDLHDRENRKKMVLVRYNYFIHTCTNFNFSNKCCD